MTCCWPGDPPPPQRGQMGILDTPPKGQIYPSSKGACTNHVDKWGGGVAQMTTTVIKQKCLHIGVGDQNCPKFCPRGLYTAPKLNFDFFFWKQPDFISGKLFFWIHSKNINWRYFEVKLKLFVGSKNIQCIVCNIEKYVLKITIPRAKKLQPETKKKKEITGLGKYIFLDFYQWFILVTIQTLCHEILSKLESRA